MVQRIAIVTGIGGQDATYLAKYLLDRDYLVVGILRRTSNPNNIRLNYIKNQKNLRVDYADVTDQASIDNIVSKYLPDEFYHLAANSFVGFSWASPSHYIETNTIGTINCLESLRKYKKDCRFYFGGSSEEYGDYVKRKGGKAVLDENSPMVAASPYGVSKVAGHQMTKVYRESYGMFAAVGLLFNHGSAVRGEEFFTRKVTSQLSRIYWGLQDNIKLGNLNAFRDEGFSGDYVRAMYMILQHNVPDDFVVATNETHSCEEWLRLTQKYFGLNDSIVEIDKTLIRPNEVNILIGDSSKIKSTLGWKPEVSYLRLNQHMCDYDKHKQSPNQDISNKAENFVFI